MTLKHNQRVKIIVSNQKGTIKGNQTENGTYTVEYDGSKKRVNWPPNLIEKICQ
jgi:hypothetical protein